MTKTEMFTRLKHTEPTRMVLGYHLRAVPLKHEVVIYWGDTVVAAWAPTSGLEHREDLEAANPVRAAVVDWMRAAHAVDWSAQ